MVRFVLPVLMLLATPALAQDVEELPDESEFAPEAPPESERDQGFVSDQPAIGEEQQGEADADPAEEQSIEELFGLPQDETEETFESVVAGERVQMRGLNKVTASVTDFQAEFDQPIRFGSLTVIARYCSRRPPEFIPETFVFLEIFDRRLDGLETTQYGEKIFSGWMLGSSPGLHGLEHPVFDVWPVECVIAARPVMPEPAGEAE